jgi:hypothetical protein
MQRGAHRRYIAAALAVAASTVAAGGVRSAPVLAGSTAGGLAVSVSYAEDIANAPAPGASFPNPWKGSPNVVFYGNVNPQSAECGSVVRCYDAGGIRLDNPGPSDVIVTKVVVDVHSSVSGGKLYNNLWGTVTVPAHQSAILTENPAANNPGFDNFDSSDTPHFNGNCTPTTVAPTIQLTVAGMSTTLTDSGHVLDTGGIDSGWCPKPGPHNESIPWHQITAGSPPPAPTQLYQLDDFGGLHSVPPSPGPSTPALWTFKIARGLVLLPGGGGGYILDGWGGIHAFGTASTAVTAPTYWRGWDIARGIALLPGGQSGYVLDGWGGIHPFAVGAHPMPPPMLIGPFWQGWDIARAFVLDSSGTGGYVLDGWGGVHRFGTDSAHTPAGITVSQYWPNWDIARGFVLRPDGVSGYTLDGWGGIHPFAIDSAHVPGVPTLSGFWLSTDIARSIVLQPGLASGGYVLNGWGDVRAFGSAPQVSSPSTTPGQDNNRGLAVT